MKTDENITEEITNFGVMVCKKLEERFMEETKKLPNGDNYFCACPIVIGRIDPITDIPVPQGKATFRAQFGGIMFILDTARKNYQTDTGISKSVHNIIRAQIGDVDERYVNENINYIDKANREESRRAQASKERDELRNHYEESKKANRDMLASFTQEKNELLERISEAKAEAKHFKELYAQAKDKK